MAVQISPSILSADFARLADEAEAVAPAADWLHVDVMDNHFVPNLTLGLPVVQSLLKHTSLPVDCHLMIEDPDRWAPAYAEAGARNVTIHAEAVKAPVRTLREIRSAGARAGLAVNPGTTVEPYADLLPEIDMLLLMTVEPGFGGQRFLDLVLPKLRRARAMVAAHGGSVWLQVDGGVSEETIERCADAGADVFVAGAAVYSADDPAQAVRALRAQAERATAHAAWGKTQPRRASRPLRRPATRPSSAPLPCKPRPRLPKAPAPATPPTPAPIASCPRWSRPVTISPRRSRATVRGRAPEPPGARRRPPDPHLPGHRHRRRAPLRRIIRMI